MAAAAFKATVSILNEATGAVTPYYCTVSDVNNEYYVFPDGNGFVQLPSNGYHRLIDINLSAAGTDTSNAQIFASGLNTGMVVVNASNLGTNYSRQFMSAGIRFKPGTLLRIQQKT